MMRYHNRAKAVEAMGEEATARVVAETLRTPANGPARSLGASQSG